MHRRDGDTVGLRNRDRRVPHTIPDTPPVELGHGAIETVIPRARGRKVLDLQARSLDGGSREIVNPIDVVLAHKRLCDRRVVVDRRVDRADRDLPESLGIDTVRDVQLGDDEPPLPPRHTDVDIEPDPGVLIANDAVRFIDDRDFHGSLGTGHTGQYRTTRRG